MATIETPMLKQYREMKEQHPDRILLFRCGDFYETYEEDAKKCATILGITLTKSVKTGVTMAGFPYHALDTYLPKLLRAKCRCAICDQLEDPRLTQRIAKRGITETFNPQQTNNQNPTDMETKTMKAADLIGKTITVGDNIATITIKSANGETLTGEFKKEGASPMTLPITMENLRQQIEAGAWRLAESDEPEVCQSDDSDSPTDEPCTDNDPVLEQWKKAKEANPDAVIIFRNGDVYVIIAEDATKVSEVAGLKTAQHGDTAICVFPSGDLAQVLPKIVGAGIRIAIVDLVAEPEAEQPKKKAAEKRGTERPKAKAEKPKVKPRTAPKEDDEPEDAPEEPLQTEEPETPTEEPAAEEVKDSKPSQEKKATTTVEPEQGGPRIIDYGKSIIVAGDTSRIEAVLLTLWGRKIPYTNKGKKYSGIQLSAKHKKTVQEIIKLVS